MVEGKLEGLPGSVTATPTALPQGRETSAAFASSSAARAHRQYSATLAIRSLLSAAEGESVLVPAGTYAHEPESIRTLAQRAGGSGWCRIHREAAGWRVVKAAPPKSKARQLQDALVRIAEADANSTNSASIDQFINWVRAVAYTALADARDSASPSGPDALPREDQ